MSRGGRGGGRGGKRGPDMSWDDEEEFKETVDTRKPGPLFPDRYFPAPRPLGASEKLDVTSLISIRDRIRRGPLYAVLDPTIVQAKNNTTTSSNVDQPITKPNPRAGFNPFNDQEKYTMKYHRKKRTVPDLSERGGYTLKLFPLELWNVLDPKRTMKDWNDLTDEQKARVSTGVTKSRKRKRDQALKFEEEEDAPPVRTRGSGSEASDDDDDPVSPSRKRKKNDQKRKSDEAKSARQKKGLDAEDDYPEVDQQDEDGEGGAGEEEPNDSEFGTDEEDEEGMDDYNAEQYFDDGADDFGDAGDGDDEGGGGGGGGYY